MDKVCISWRQVATCPTPTPLSPRRVTTTTHFLLLLLLSPHTQFQNSPRRCEAEQAAALSHSPTPPASELVWSCGPKLVTSFRSDALSRRRNFRGCDFAK